MKPILGMLLGTVLLSGAAFASNENIRSEDRERALAFARCSSLTGDAKAQCERDATRGSETARSDKQGYWSPKQMADRAKGRIKNAAGAVERKIERKKEDTAGK